MVDAEESTERPALLPVPAIPAPWLLLLALALALAPVAELPLRRFIFWTAAIPGKGLEGVRLTAGGGPTELVPLPLAGGPGATDVEEPPGAAAPAAAAAVVVAAVTAPLACVGGPTTRSGETMRVGEAPRTGEVTRGEVP
mmetsp:Transcript_93612/g.195182  ORF Transcript_93612/g.195182 Transcript_93612/m.195182 type:complete len:140 (-) Transcript_93612:1054-1473(-)